MAAPQRPQKRPHPPRLSRCYLSLTLTWPITLTLSKTRSVAVRPSTARPRRCGGFDGASNALMLSKRGIENHQDVAVQWPDSISNGDDLRPEFITNGHCCPTACWHGAAKGSGQQPLFVCIDSSPAADAISTVEGAGPPLFQPFYQPPWALGAVPGGCLGDLALALASRARARASISSRKLKAVAHIAAMLVGRTAVVQERTRRSRRYGGCFRQIARRPPPNSQR